jgi:hypothetical protein
MDLFGESWNQQHIIIHIRIQLCTQISIQEGFENCEIYLDQTANERATPYSSQSVDST